MHLPSPSLYDHLTEVELIPDALHPLLRQIARTHGAELRWMHKGGNPHGQTLFVSPAFDRAIPLAWDGVQYYPAIALDAKTQAESPRLFSVFVDAILRRVRGGAR